jgi:hypothetical protein
MRSSLRNRRVPRAPLPGSCQGDLKDRLRRRYSPFIARTGSCARPPFSPGLGSPQPVVFAGCGQSLLKGGPSRHYPCTPCVGAWTHTPPCLCGAHTRFFPHGCGLAPVETCSAHGTLPAKQLQQEAGVSWLRSFAHVQAPTLAWPPGCTHRAETCMSGTGGRAVYTTHRPGGYPRRDVASLRACYGLLARPDSHRLDYSLVGCSFHHPAPPSV